MTEQQVIDLINSVIRANGNEEITGSILNSVLLAMVEQPNNLIGDFNTTTVTGNTIIEKINALSSLIADTSGIKLYTGDGDPNITPPVSYNVADFYAQTSSGIVFDLWQYDGTQWINRQNVIDDLSVSTDTTFSSQKITELINTQDGIITVTSINVSGNLVTIGAGSQWRISGVTYTNNNDVTLTVPYSAIGYSRLDNILGNTSNSFELQQGTQTNGIAVAPLKPLNKVVITTVSVTENSINDQSDLNVKMKSESGYVLYNGVGVATNINISNDSSNILLTNTTSLGSLNIANPDNIYAGKSYTISNNNTVEITLLNNGGNGNIKFLLPNSSSYYMRPKEVVSFMLLPNLRTLVYTGSSIGGVSASNRNLILMDLNEDGSVFTQGVTGNVILKSYTIPLNKVNKSGVFIINLRMSKPEGVEATFNSSVNFDISNNQFPFNSMNSQAANNKFVSGIRNVKSIYNPTANTSLMSSFTSSGNYYTDYMPHANIVPSKVVNYDVDGLRVFVIVNTTSLTDKISLDFLTIEFLEL